MFYSSSWKVLKLQITLGALLTTSWAPGWQGTALLHAKQTSLSQEKELLLVLGALIAATAKQTKYACI